MEIILLIIVGLVFLRFVFAKPAPQAEPIYMIVPYEAPPGPGGIGPVILLLIAVFLLIAFLQPILRGAPLP